MGLEATCSVKLNDQTSEGAAQCGDGEIDFRGDFRFKWKWSDLSSIGANKGTLTVHRNGDVAEFELGVSGHDDDMFGPPRQTPYPMPGLPAALGDRLMAQSAGRLGFKVRVSPQARNSQPFDGRPACCASSS